MKTVLLVVAVVVVSVFMVSCMIGCVTAQQQAELDRSSMKLAKKIEDIEKYEDDLKEILAKVKAGVIPAAEGAALYEAVKEDIEETKEAAEEFQETIDRILAEGGSGFDVATGLLLSLGQILANLGIIRVWRGSTVNRNGDIGVRTPTVS